MEHFMEQHLPTVDRSGHPVPWAVGAAEKLKKRLHELRLPPNPLDDLIERLGGARKVAEMTGRSHRLELGTDGRRRLVPRSSSGSSDSINLQEQRHFQRGRKNIAIITEAASA